MPQSPQVTRKWLPHSVSAMEGPSTRMVRTSPLMHHTRNRAGTNTAAISTTTASRRRLSGSVGMSRDSDMRNRTWLSFVIPSKTAGEHEVRRSAQAESRPDVVPGQLLIQKEQGERDEDSESD